MAPLTVVHVAEKNSVAKAAAGIISRSYQSNLSNRAGEDQYCRVYEFDAAFNAPGMGGGGGGVGFGVGLGLRAGRRAAAGRWAGGWAGDPIVRARRSVAAGVKREQ